jgi:thiamine-monophosphate kinase
MINSSKNMNEFELIRQYFDWGFGVGDDCAVVNVAPNNQLVTTIDTLISGVHFPKNTAPKNIAHKALAVNLSDLAAMGATPKYFTLALTLPNLDTVWLAEFSNALKLIAQTYHIKLVGGDTTKGALSISISAAGEVKTGQALMRCNAEVGDLIYVSNTLGDAALAWWKIQNQQTPEKSLLEAFNTPIPQVILGENLIGVASSCIDISDGLLQDLGHILNQSGVGATLDLNQIPVSEILEKHLEKTHHWCLPLSGGDDYELCFTVPTSKVERIKAIENSLGIKLTQIGMITPEQRLKVQGLTQACQSYQHF